MNRDVSLLVDTCLHTFDFLQILTHGNTWSVVDMIQNDEIISIKSFCCEQIFSIQWLKRFFESFKCSCLYGNGMNEWFIVITVQRVEERKKMNIEDLSQKVSW